MKCTRLKSQDLYQYYLIANSLVHPTAGNKARIFEIMITGNHIYGLNRTQRHYHYKQLFVLQPSTYEDFSSIMWSKGEAND